MAKVTRYPTMAALELLLLLPATSKATTCRVGPVGKYTNVFEVPGGFRTGEILKITGDVVHSNRDVDTRFESTCKTDGTPAPACAVGRLCRRASDLRLYRKEGRTSCMAKDQRPLIVS